MSDLENLTEFTEPCGCIILIRYNAEACFGYSKSFCKFHLAAEKVVNLMLEMFEGGRHVPQT